MDNEGIKTNDEVSRGRSVVTVEIDGVRAWQRSYDDAGNPVTFTTGDVGKLRAVEATLSEALTEVQMSPTFDVAQRITDVRRAAAEINRDVPVAG
ncbi:MAG TPA: hypothetical protein VLC46_01595 [Thermoanaerobaculia bacterium]|jgi:hypothetical protein|nr:hypothetical protein [Thermoanaerobaculia bacterium]